MMKINDIVLQFNSEENLDKALKIADKVFSKLITDTIEAGTSSGMCGYNHYLQISEEIEIDNFIEFIKQYNQETIENLEDYV